MKKLILPLLVLTGIFMILVIISMSLYIHSYEPWYSFMTIEKAIITLVSSCILLIMTLLTMVLIILKWKKIT